MASSRKPNPLDWGSSSSVRGLSLAGLVLLALYGSILLGSLFPIQLLASAWQLKLGSALINAAPFPLIGLGPGLIQSVNSVLGWAVASPSPAAP